MPEERRIVTVLFADVTGSTALGESLDAEDVRTLMSRYYALAKRVVADHGGTIEKFIGDAVMAVFGLPQAHGDDAERGAAAALALRDAVAADTTLARLRPCFGVDTGEAVTTSDATAGDFLVTGTVVNMAARLQQAAEPEQVLVGDRTRRAAPGFDYGAVAEIRVKGRADAIRAWPLRGRAERIAAEASFVDRNDDLEQLELAAGRAFREARPQHVTITGPAGSGKSRLLRELVRRLRAERSDIRVAIAQCPPYGATLAYAPLRGLLVRLLELPADASTDAIAARLVAIGGEDMSEEAGLIALSLRPEAAAERREPDQVLAAWRHALERLAHDAPLLLIFDDLQWAAETLLDLVSSLTRATAGAPLLAVTLARSELLERRPAWGAGRRRHISLALGPLEDAHVAALVAELLGDDVAPSVRQRIVDRADGNPFFASELARAVRERAELADDRADVELPETVHATVLARLDLLPPTERAALDAASVVGRSLDVDTVAAITREPPTTIEAALDGLVEQDLLERVAQRAYAFRDLLVREVAYQTLPRSRRATDHARLARSLEPADAGETERADLIAFHYVESARLRRASTIAPADQDEEAVREKAVAWTLRAARAGIASGAAPEAAALCRAAIPLATPAEELAVQETLTRALVTGDDALIAHRRAIELWRVERGDAATGTRLIADYLFAALGYRPTFTEAHLPTRDDVVRLSDEALELARHSGDERALAMALTVIGQFAFAGPDPRRFEDLSRDMLERSRRAASEAAAIFERVRDWHGLRLAAIAEANARSQLGDFEGAFAAAARSGPHRPQMSDADARSAASIAAWHAAPVGRIEEGMSAARECAAGRPAGSALRTKLGGLSTVALFAAMKGDWDEAVRVTREAVEVSIEAPKPWPPFAVAAVAAGFTVLRRRGEVALAPQLAETAAPALPRQRASDEDLDAIPARQRLWRAGSILRAAVEGDAAAATRYVGRFDLSDLEGIGQAAFFAERAFSLLAGHRVAPSGIEDYDALIEYAVSHGLRPMAAQLLRLRSIARGGNADDLRRAREILRSLGMVPDAALATLELAALTRDGSLLAEAQGDLERIGDVVGLERAREVAFVSA